MHFATLHHHYYYYPNKLGNTTLSYSELSLIALLGQHYSHFLLFPGENRASTQKEGGSIISYSNLTSSLCLPTNSSLQELSMGMDEKTPMQGPEKALHWRPFSDGDLAMGVTVKNLHYQLSPSSKSWANDGG